MSNNRRHALIAYAALSLTACVAEEPQAEDVGQVSQATCRTCDPGTSNDKGVIEEEGGNSCLQTLDHGTVCPLAFLSDPGGVKVRLRDPYNTTQWTVDLSATYNGNPVTLRSIDATQTVVTVTYVGPWGIPVAVTGANLSSFVFSFKLAALDHESILLSLNQAGESPRLVNGVNEQNLRWRTSNSTSGWGFLCQDSYGTDDPASLYQGAFFEPFTGARTNNSGVTMLSCRKGAITTCMEWDYKPWRSATHVQQGWQSLENAHVACIQMKRAAYCGDDSYTKHGTPIARDDAYGIHNEISSATPLEAVWSPSGAVCVNMNNRRHMDVPFGGSCNGIALQACPASEPWWWAIGGLTANGIYLN